MGLFFLRKNKKTIMEEEKLGIILKLTTEPKDYGLDESEIEIVGIFEESEAWNLHLKLKKLKEKNITYFALQLPEKEVLTSLNKINIHRVYPDKYGWPSEKELQQDIADNFPFK